MQWFYDRFDSEMVDKCIDVAYWIIAVVGGLFVGVIAWLLLCRAGGVN